MSREGFTRLMSEPDSRDDDHLSGTGTAPVPETVIDLGLSSTSPTSPLSMKLSVKTITGQNYPVELSPDATHVVAIKQQLEDTQGFPISFQRLVFGGRELQDDELLSTVGVRDGSTLHLLLRTNPPAAAPAQVADGGQLPMAPGVLNGIPMGVPIIMPAAYNHGDNQGAQGDNLIALNNVYRLAKDIRLFGWIDLISVLWIALNTGFYFLLILLPLVLTGIRGAQWFQHRLVSFYLVFQVLIFGFRMWLTVDAGKRGNYWSVAILGINILLQLIISNFIFRFYAQLRRLSYQDCNELRQWRQAEGQAALAALG